MVGVTTDIVRAVWLPSRVLYPYESMRIVTKSLSDGRPDDPPDPTQEAPLSLLSRLCASQGLGSGTKETSDGRRGRE